MNVRLNQPGIDITDSILRSIFAFKKYLYLTPECISAIKFNIPAKGFFTHS